jgi:hypothetical protein
MVISPEITLRVSEVNSIFPMDREEEFSFNSLDTLLATEVNLAPEAFINI